MDPLDREIVWHQHMVRGEVAGEGDDTDGAVGGRGKPQPAGDRQRNEEDTHDESDIDPGHATRNAPDGDRRRRHCHDPLLTRLGTVGNAS
jgi:hypothetical protein